MAHVFSAYRRLAGLALGLAVLAAAGCAHRPGSSPGLGALPAHYRGTLPCADCAGIDYSLSLAADHVYVLREHYHSDRAVSDLIEAGHWRVRDALDQLELTPSDTDSRFTSLWRINSHDELIALDAQGHPVANGHYTLARTKGPAERRLAGPRWILTDAPDRPGASPAYIRFHDDTHRVTGSTGCNRLMARYQRKNDRLHLERIATTRRACPDRADTEQAMREALRRTQRFETLGNFLLLYGSDRDPSPLAVFRAAT
ncbi:META domain-containing protein [Salinisphaera sp.]|uniref:META domain-containing protein n=1 Tax=Salinisphaera sp. TaxID=1914330 RepID=UPI002D774F8D|nr:copper resistance protein NlpE N-terminal domain-containing protein [Salinisphaera sp.]HET7312757.1 copper resistance protein NlpE N-terminal domain-containing protein [Salinisphaera sp.]